jgi:hypothetical protein
MSHALEQHGSHISSFMKVVNHRLDKLKEGMQLNYKIINELTKSTTNFHKLMTNLSVDAFDQINKANEILIQLVQSLINGKITPHLIPEHTLRKTIDGIVGILQKDYPQFHLIQNKPSMFYQNAIFFFTRRGSLCILQYNFH